MIENLTTLLSGIFETVGILILSTAGFFAALALIFIVARWVNGL